MVNLKSIIYSILGLIFITLSIIAPKMLLLLFAGYIFHVFLSSLSQKTQQLLPISYSVSLGLVLTVLFILFAGYWVYLVPVLSDQVSQFAEKIPELKSRLVELLSPYFSKPVLERELSFESLKEVAKGKAFLKEMNALASGLLFTLTSFFVVLIIGIYFAISPQQYRNILTSLIPPNLRNEADGLFSKIHKSIKWWLVGRLSSMGLVALLSTIGLAVLDIQLALALGLFAGVASFIPNLGPIISVVPAVLVALLHSPQTALSVLILYLGIQTVESYFITPFITDKVVSIPPAWLIGLQLIIGSTYGILGLALAAPMMVVMVVLTRQIFIKKILGDPSIESLV